MSTKTLHLRLAFILVVALLATFLAFPPQEKLTFGLDLGGGIHLELDLALDEAVRSESARERGVSVSEEKAAHIRERAAEATRETIARRVDELGLTQPLIARTGPDGARLTVRPGGEAFHAAPVSPLFRPRDVPEHRQPRGQQQGRPSPWATSAAPP